MMRRTINIFAVILIAGTAQGQALDGKTQSDVEAGQTRVLSKTGALSADCLDGFAGIFPCQNINLLAHMSLQEVSTSGAGLNDLWGWEDPDTGRRYVLLGRRDGTSFVDVTDPAAPRLVGEMMRTPGALASVWRDVKVYDNYAFVVSDGAGAHGLQVFDLTQLRTASGPGTVTFTEQTRYEGFGSAHNIVINEESGFAYAVGTSSGECTQGLHMIDIRNPRRPLFAGCHRDLRTRRAYTHDAQCVIYSGPHTKYQGREICVAANEDSIALADVTDKANPVSLGVGTYPTNQYVHQGWLSEDQRYFYQNDELDEGRLGQTTRTMIWDVSDLDDPQLASEFDLGTTSIDHNLYVRGQVLYEANYTSGLRVLDVSDPVNPLAIGHFDTTPDNGAVSYGGTWSVYPYFSDGTVAVSSRGEGLFLLRISALLESLLADHKTTTSASGIQIGWTMARQRDVEWFELLRLLPDGSSSVVATTAGGGTVSVSQDFELVAAGLPPGKSRIRLVTVSAAGSQKTLFEEDVYVVPGTHLLADIYPNPTNTSAQVALIVAAAQVVSVKVYDTVGRQVATLFEGVARPEEELTFQLNVAAWPAGRYWVRIEGQAFSDSRTLIVSH
ncbi:MAG: choice-of-anchor B domain-containing protein [Rhodothermales bacterium]|jgi:choice-of-anchor B domain-containing protein